MASKETKTISPSKAVAAKTIYEAFRILKAEGGDKKQELKNPIISLF
jgi:hypothetical protein